MENKEKGIGFDINTVEYKDSTLRNEEVVAPKNLVSTYDQANILRQNLENNQIKRSDIFDKIDKLKKGAPPVSKEELAKKGLSYLANNNWRDYKAESKKVVQSFKNIVSGRYFVDFSTKLFDPKTNAKISQKVSKLITDELRKNAVFNYNLDLLITEMVDFGCVGILFNDRKGEDLYIIPPNNIFFPPEAPACSSLLPYIAIGHELSPDYLWSVYEKMTDTSKWKKEALGRLLYEESNQYSSDTSYTAAWSQVVATQVRNKEMSYSSLYTGNIKVFTFLVREYDGKYTRFIISQRQSVNDFLFYKDREFSRIEEYVQIFFLEDGVRYAKDVKGLGQDTYSGFQQLNKVKNGFINMFTMGGTAFIENKGGGMDNLKSFKMIPHGINILPVGVGSPQFGNVPQINYLLPGIEWIRNSITKANIYLESNQIPTSNEVKGVPGYPGDLSASVKASKENIEFFLEQLDSFWRVYLGKILKNPQSSIRKRINEYLELIDKKLPDILFDTPNFEKEWDIPNHITIKASRIVTKGNVLLDQVALDNVAAMSNQLSEEKQKEFMKLMLDQLTDENFSDFLLPEEDMKPTSSISNTMATVIGNQLARGEKVTWSKDLNHEIYAQTLLDLCYNFIGQYNEAEDKSAILQSTADALTSLVEFIAPSIQYLKRDRTKKEVNEYFNQRFYQVVGYANGIVANAQTQQEAIARKQVELQTAGQPDMNNPKVLEILTNAELKKLQIKQDGQIKMFKELESQKIKFALNNAELAYKKELSGRELEIQSELDYKELQSNNTLNFLKVMDGAKR